MQEETLQEKQAVQLRLQGAMDMQTALEKSYEAKVQCLVDAYPCLSSQSLVTELSWRPRCAGHDMLSFQGQTRKVYAVISASSGAKLLLCVDSAF